MSDDPPTLPVLGYTRPPAFGWRDDGDDLVLTLPPRPRWEVLAERGTALVAATTFMLVVCGVAVDVGRSAARNAAAGPVAPATAVGMLAIGVWVLVLVRFVADARTAPAAATVRVSPGGGLFVDHAPGWGDGGRRWPPGTIAGVRLDLVRRAGGRVRHARLQVVGPIGTVVAFALPWPPDVPPEPYELRLRDALGLPPRDVTDAGRA